MSPDGEITINESRMLCVIGTSTTDRWVVYTPSYALNDTLLFKFSPKDREGSLKEKEIIQGCRRLVQAWI
mgnify:CR=1 FL=1